MAKAPKPPALKLLNGRTDHTDSGGRPVNMGPGFKREGLGSPPPELELDLRAVEVWEDLVPELDRLEISKRPDRYALARFCVAVSRAETADAKVLAEGLLVLNVQGNWMKNPAVGIAEQASREIRAWCQEFGLTPSAEGRIIAPQKDPVGGDNPYAEGNG